MYVVMYAFIMLRPLHFPPCIIHTRCTVLYDCAHATYARYVALHTIIHTIMKSTIVLNVCAVCTLSTPPGTCLMMILQYVDRNRPIFYAIHFTTTSTAVYSSNFFTQNLGLDTVLARRTLTLT